MTYATRDDMVQAFGEDELIDLTDRAETGEMDDTVIAAALAAAAAEIDGYVGRVAALPLTTVPANLRQLALAIARYRLDTDEKEGRLRLDYEDAVSSLRDIAKGVVALDLPSAEAPAQMHTRVRGGSAAPVFDRRRLGKDWP